MSEFIFGETQTIVRKYAVWAKDYAEARRTFLADEHDPNLIRLIEDDLVKSEWWCETNARTD